MYSLFLLFKCLLGVVFLTGVICERHLPKDFPRCYRDDPDMAECIRKATETVRPLIIGGVPALDIPPLEPFKLDEIKFQQGTKSLNINAIMTNVKMYGLSKYKFSKFSIDMKSLEYICELSVPGLTLDGNYKLEGQILVVPIKGNGKFNASVSKVDVTFYQKGKRVKKNGNSYLIPIYTNSTILATGPKITLDGLFAHNPELSKLTAKAINDNINSLYEEMRPIIEKIINNFMQRTMSAVSSEISEDELYPPSKS